MRWSNSKNMEVDQPKRYFRKPVKPIDTNHMRRYVQIIVRSYQTSIRITDEVMIFRSLVHNSMLATGLSVLVVACATPIEHSKSSAITLIRYKPDPSRIDMLASLRGILEVRNHCIYLVHKQSGTAGLVIWPSTYELLWSGNRAIGIKDTRTHQSLKFGITAQFGGGEEKNIIDSELNTTIPEACTGSRLSLYLPS